MQRILIIGKSDGILNWFEDVVYSAPNSASSFSMNRAGLNTRILKFSLGSESTAYNKAIATSARKAIIEARPSHIIIIDCFYLSKEINNDIKKSGALVHQWIGDFFDERLANNTSVHRFYFTDSYLVEIAKSRRLNAFYLPLGTTKIDEAPLDWSQRKNEILFVGAPNMARIKVLQEINHPTIVIGPKWPTIHNAHIRILNKRISLSSVKDLYMQHRFVLNIINSDNIFCGLPARCFDATASGCCLITDDVADLRKNFDVGREVAIYSDSKSLNQQILNLTANLDYAKKIADAGKARTAKNHLLKHRLSLMLGE